MPLATPSLTATDSLIVEIPGEYLGGYQPICNQCYISSNLHSNHVKALILWTSHPPPRSSFPLYPTSPQGSWYKTRVSKSCENDRLQESPNAWLLRCGLLLDTCKFCVIHIHATIHPSWREIFNCQTDWYIVDWHSFTFRLKGGSGSTATDES